MKLTDFFEKIYILNLPYKPERRERLTAELAKFDLVDFEHVEWVRAVSGDMCPAPAYFQAGNGAWGCLQSHIRIVQDAIMDEVGSCLILEDDVHFHPQSRLLLERFFGAVPADWDQLYLGGQHLQEPVETSVDPVLLRGTNINRTHAYGLHQRVYAKFLQHIYHAPDYLHGHPRHIDHQLGLAHERRDWNVYCPTWWVAGQADGPSNISGRMNAEMWWQPGQYAHRLPFVFVPPDTAATDVFLNEYVHFGWNLKPDTFADSGLDSVAAGYKGLGEWMHMIAGEAICRYRVPGICHPGISLEAVRRQWPAVEVWNDRSDLAGLCNYPLNGLFDNPLTQGITGDSALVTA